MNPRNFFSASTGKEKWLRLRFLTIFKKCYMFLLPWYVFRVFIKELCMYQGYSFHFRRASLPESTSILLYTNNFMIFKLVFRIRILKTELLWDNKNKNKTRAIIDPGTIYTHTHKGGDKHFLIQSFYHPCEAYFMGKGTETKYEVRLR